MAREPLALARGLTGTPARAAAEPPQHSAPQCRQVSGLPGALLLQALHVPQRLSRMPYLQSHVLSDTGSHRVSAAQKGFPPGHPSPKKSVFVHTRPLNFARFGPRADSGQEPGRRCSSFRKAGSLPLPVAAPPLRMAFETAWSSSWHSTCRFLGRCWLHGALLLQAVVRALAESARLLRQTDCRSCDACCGTWRVASSPPSRSSGGHYM